MSSSSGLRGTTRTRYPESEGRVPNATKGRLVELDRSPGAGGEASGKGIGESSNIELNVLDTPSTSTTVASIVCWLAKSGIRLWEVSLKNPERTLDTPC